MMSGEFPESLVNRGLNKSILSLFLKVWSFRVRHCVGGSVTEVASLLAFFFDTLFVFLSTSLDRARASTDHFFFCLRTLMKVTSVL